MRDPEQVARAQRAAARLEAAWEGWRATQGLADTPAQPVVGYVGYALKEPWGQPRAVIGFSADEAERLAEHLEHGTTTTTLPPQTARSSAKTTPAKVKATRSQPAKSRQSKSRPTEPQPAEPQVAAPRDPASGPQPVQ